ncbi:SdpI family protein [Halovivax cerinus]|uniref:SdpI family protein n=1 Tax=Halovivax cerinus TaxID=1487865 RepID=A0ABD5NJP4_9EURY|nr:SdpI family protein [Halovivax cerinus]
MTGSDKTLVPAAFAPVTEAFVPVPAAFAPVTEAFVPVPAMFAPVTEAFERTRVSGRPAAFISPAFLSPGVNTRQRLAIAFGIVGLSAVVSVAAAPALPERLVTHWNAAGTPDGSMDKWPALASTPALATVVVALLAVVPRIDPLGDTVASVRPAYDWFVVGFAGFLAVVHGGVIAYNLGYAFDVTLALLGAAACLFYGVGVLLGRVERNWFVGVRTPWTLASDEVWDRTHDLASHLFKLSAVIAAIGLGFDEYAVYFLLGPVVVTAIGSVGYSYYLYERLATDATTSGG